MTGHKLFAESFVTTSGQAWKVYLCSVLVVGLTGASATAWSWGLESPETVIVAMTSAGAALAVFGWACISIRCPRCSAKLMWLEVRRPQPMAWLHRLMAHRDCPECSYDPGRGQRSPSTSRDNAMRSLFGGYFHQDWRLAGETWGEVVHTYIREQSPADKLRQIATELRELATRFRSDQELLDYLNRELACDYLPEDPARVWVMKIADVIDEHLRS